MKTETPPEQPVLSDETANRQDAVAQPKTQRVAYKTVLAAVVIGILTVGALWMFVIRQEGSPKYEAPVMEADVQVQEDTVTKALPSAKADPAVESMDRRLVSLSGQIDRGFEVQQTHSTVVQR